MKPADLLLTRYRAHFDLHYRPGTLTAVARTGGAAVFRTSQTTAGEGCPVSPTTQL